MSKRLPLLCEPSEAHVIIQQLNSENVDYPVCIVDLCSPESYAHGHVEGAVSIPIHILMSGQPPAAGKLPSTEQLTRLFSYLGTNENTHFIVYDDEGGGWAGRFAWTLDIIKHKHVSVINGGLIAWQQDGLPLTEQPFSPEPTPVSINIDKSQLISATQIVDNLANPQFAIWDARSPAEYAGVNRYAARGGHIPGAINVEWTSMMDPTRGYRVRDDALHILEQKGLSRDKHIVTHCQSHHRSGYTYLVGKHLGLNIRAYDGAWSEWGNTPELPVEP